MFFAVKTLGEIASEFPSEEMSGLLDLALRKTMRLWALPFVAVGLRAGRWHEVDALARAERAEDVARIAASIADKSGYPCLARAFGTFGGNPFDFPCGKGLNTKRTTPKGSSPGRTHTFEVVASDSISDFEAVWNSRFRPGIQTHNFETSKELIRIENETGIVLRCNH